MSNIINKPIMKKQLYTIIAILGFANFTLAQVPSYVPTNGLLGYYPFSGNANDVSGNGKNGTINFATLGPDRYGNINSAYNFNNSNITLPFTNSNFANNFTISIWVNIDTFSSAYPTFLVGQNDYLKLQFAQLVPVSKANFYFANGLGSGLTDGNVIGGNILTKTWINIVIKDSSKIVKLYINGNLISTSTNPSNYQGNTVGSNLKVGNGNTLPIESFIGKTDDIGIWNRALTQAEITALYLGCSDTISTQPTNLSGAKGTNKTFSFTHSGTGYNNQWQSNSVALGWQNVPNTNQYSGVTTNSLAVNGLTVSNHNQLFRVISSKQGCADTSNIVKLTVSDVATDSLNVIALKTDTTTKGNTIRQLQNDSISKLGIITSLKTDTTNKGNTIRQLQTDLANKHDTLYVSSTITTDTLKISIRTGISTASPVINSLKVYPNPASTLLNIVIEKPGYYVAKLSSVTGQSIITPTSGTIDISALANGVYILTIYDSNNKLISTNKVSIIK